jgi:hypothetical protein
MMGECDSGALERIPQLLAARIRDSLETRACRYSA